MSDEMTDYSDLSTGEDGDEATCFCGCGRTINGSRAKAANKIAYRYEADLTTFRRALDEGWTPDEAADLEQLIAEGGPLVDRLRARLHDEISRKDLDKKAMRAWYKRAGDARKEVWKTALGQNVLGSTFSGLDTFFTGTQATGVVVNVRDTGTTVNTDVRIELTIEVHPDDGEPFRLERKVLVPRVAFPRVGDHVQIGYDPDDPDKFSFKVIPAPVAPAPAAAVEAPLDQRIAQLKELAELRDQGILTDEEFGAQKQQVLDTD